MKKLMIGAAMAALCATSAMAFGPNPADANPPGALFASKPGGIDHVPRAVQEQAPYGWSNSTVGLTTRDVRTHRQHRSHHAM